MTNAYMTPERGDHVVSRQRPRYVEAQYRLRRLDAALQTLRPIPDDYPDAAAHDADLELWQDQTQALQELGVFISDGLGYIESPSELRPQGSYAVTNPPPAKAKVETEEPTEEPKPQRRAEGEDADD